MHMSPPLCSMCRHGETLLHLAAINGNPSAVRMLVEAGADTEAADALGRTVRGRRGAMGEHPARCRCLLCCSLRPTHQVGGSQLTTLLLPLALPHPCCAVPCQALHTAALSAHKACLLALLESGAAVDAADSDGRTGAFCFTATVDDTCRTAQLLLPVQGAAQLLRLINARSSGTPPAPISLPSPPIRRSAGAGGVPRARGLPQGPAGRGRLGGRPGRRRLEPRPCGGAGRPPCLPAGVARCRRWH